MAGLKKLEIIAYKDKTFATETGNSFTMMVNPSDYAENKVIEYDEKKVADGGNTPAYKGYKDEDIKFEFCLDTTGVLIDRMGKPTAEDLRPLSATIKILETTVYTYVGDTHEPPYLNIAWGTLNYLGRLKSMNINYQLFNSAGEPLRAKITLTLLKYIDEATQLRLKGKSSPDLSHLITVKDGDTLPALCQRVYKNTTYCAEVARVNGLTGFRSLKPGTQLLFPPLASPPTPLRRREEMGEA